MGTGGRNLKKEAIFNIVEAINHGFQAVDFEFGNGENVPKIINNGGIYELKMYNKIWIINISEKQNG